MGLVLYLFNTLNNILVHQTQGGINPQVGNSPDTKTFCIIITNRHLITTFLYTKNRELEETICWLFNEIVLIQNNSSYQTEMISGDFNFSNLTWYNDILKIYQNLAKQQQMLA